VVFGILRQVTMLARRADFAYDMRSFLTFQAAKFFFQLGVTLGRHWMLFHRLCSAVSFRSLANSRANQRRPTPVHDHPK
jgi:hypothetical protein